MDMAGATSTASKPGRVCKNRCRAARVSSIGILTPFTGNALTGRHYIPQGQIKQEKRFFVTCKYLFDPAQDCFYETKP